MFERNQMVKFVKNGVEIEGRIGDKRCWCDLEPSYCDSQEVNYKPGRMGWGYKVHAPIVKADGTFYTDRNGKPLMGLGYEDEKILQAL